MPHTRVEWKAANALVIEIEAERAKLLAPTKERYDAACLRLEEIEEDLPELIGKCETCMEPIFEGDSYMSESEACIYECKNCAPTWQDMLDGYENWQNTQTGDPLTKEEAIDWAGRHIEKGGLLTDSMAT